MSDGTTAVARMFLRLGNSRNAPPSWLPMRKLDAWVRAAAVCRLRLKAGTAERNRTRRALGELIGPSLAPEAQARADEQGQSAPCKRRSIAAIGRS